MCALVAQFRAVHAGHFGLAERINEFANRQLFGTKVSKQDRQSVLLAALLPRLLTAFQATVITAERGMLSEVRLLVRKILEVTFRAVAIARDDEVARLYVLSDEVQRKKFINKHRMLSDPVRTPHASPEIDAMYADISRRIQEESIQELSVQWFAERAGLRDFYNSAYAILSESAHANVRDLESVLDVDTEGNIAGLKYGADEEGLDDLLLTASEAVIISLEAAFKVLPSQEYGQLEELRAEMNTLFQPPIHET